MPRLNCSRISWNSCCSSCSFGSARSMRMRVSRGELSSKIIEPEIHERIRARGGTRRGSCRGGTTFRRRARSPRRHGGSTRRWRCRLRPLLQLGEGGDRVGVFRVMLMHPTVHREGLVRRTHARQRVAQGEIGGEQRGAIARLEGDLHPLLVVPDRVRSQRHQSLRDVRGPAPLAQSLEPVERQLQLLEPASLLAAGQQPVRQKKVKLRVVGILEDEALQLHDARRSARLDRYQRQVTQRCRWLRLAVPCLIERRLYQAQIHI